MSYSSYYGGFSATTTNYGSYVNISPTIIGNCVAVGFSQHGMVFAPQAAPYSRNISNDEFTELLRQQQINNQFRY